MNGQVEEAVDVYLGGANGPAANPPIKIMEDVPCAELAQTLHGLIRHGAFKAMRQQLRKILQTTSINDAGPPGKKRTGALDDRSKGHRRRLSKAGPYER